MEGKTDYDVAIAGGGLAGLACSIELARAGYAVVLMEKEAYPFHKVCGEYVSLESWDYLQRLGLPLADMQLPQIRKLLLTAPNGRALTVTLPLGGFGISRHLLDHRLFQLAKAAGVTILEETKVEEIKPKGPGFVVQIQSRRSVRKEVRARLCFDACGKRSNLDIKWKRGFLQGRDKRLENYVGIKYHVVAEWPDDVIGLHNFDNGYCGISRIEENNYCLCYLAHANGLKRSGNDVSRFQKEVLYRNPHLKKIFEQATVAEGFPVAIAQISFASKTQVEQGVLMLGDSAGMITPLCGNGMSMALHTAHIAAELGTSFLKGELSREGLEERYRKSWADHFAARLRAGRVLQRFFGRAWLSNLFVATVRTFPFFNRALVRLTHGKPF